MTEFPTADLEARRTSFLGAGLVYDQARPDYPSEAIRWVLTSDESVVVIDVGCGSGKLTCQLAELGHAVIGVDPKVEMLRVVVAKNLPAICGRAEALPLKGGCADVVTAAQAFHWFDHEQAVGEMRRVLHAGGRVGLLWNLRDETVDWVRRLSDIIGSEDAMARTIGPLDEMLADIERKLRHQGDSAGSNTGRSSTARS